MTMKFRKGQPEMVRKWVAEMSTKATFSENMREYGMKTIKEIKENPKLEIKQTSYRSMKDWLNSEVEE